MHSAILAKIVHFIAVIGRAPQRTSTPTRAWPPRAAARPAGAVRSGPHQRVPSASPSTGAASSAPKRLLSRSSTPSGWGERHCISLHLRCQFCQILMPLRVLLQRCAALHRRRHGDHNGQAAALHCAARQWARPQLLARHALLASVGKGLRPQRRRQARHVYSHCRCFRSAAPPLTRSRRFNRIGEGVSAE